MLAHIMMVYLTYLHLLNNLEQIFIDYEQNKSGKNQKCNLIVVIIFEKDLISLGKSTACS